MTTKELAITAAIVAVLIVFAIGADYFRTLRRGLARWSAVRFCEGLSAGVALIIATAVDVRHAPALVAIVFTIAAVLASTANRDSELVEALLTGSILSGGAVLPLLVARRMDLAVMAAISGPAATAGMFMATPRRPWIRLLAVMSALIAAFGAAFAVSSVEELSMTPVPLLVILSLPSLVVIALTVARWPVVTRELSDEASLGFFEHGEIRRAANPFRRMKLGVWIDREARRRFVQIATDLAARKKRQRGMEIQRARLHQLEIMKLRMEMKEIESIELSLAVPADPTYPSEQQTRFPADDMQTKG